jgi:hypothetical protein
MNRTIDITQVNPFDLPSVPIDKRSGLPETSGIYFALSEAEDILYIGKATSIRRRWEMHHRTKQLKTYGSVRIAWFDYASASDDELTAIEKACIEYFEPFLNQTAIPDMFLGDRRRHSLYLDNALVGLCDQAYKEAAHELYPAEISKSDFLEACFKFALEHRGDIEAALIQTAM